MAALSRTTAAPAPLARGVAAEDLAAAVRVHADRVHDAVRRLGCDSAAAAQVVEESALDLVEVVADRPETVEDAVGWWFARARALGRRVASRSDDLPLGSGVLSVDEDQEILAESLEQLPERERVALLLRDSYDLPAVSVGAALGTDADGAMELVGRARLALLPLVDDEPAPAVPAHVGNLAALARIAEGGPIAARDATTRRHALSCAGCRTLTDALQRAHLLLTGLTVVALPERERAALLARVDEQVFSVLPRRSDVVAVEDGTEQEWDDDEEDPRLFSPLLALLSLVLAVLVGLGVGLLLSREGGLSSLVASGVGPDLDVVLVTPEPLPTEQILSPPPLQAPQPRTSVYVIPPPPPPPPPPPAPEPTPTPTAEPLTLTVSPQSGPNGAELTVSGTGWDPGQAILLQYLDPTGTPTGSENPDVQADERGRFTATLIAQDPNNLPGRHIVRATSSTQTADASYDAEA